MANNPSLFSVYEVLYDAYDENGKLVFFDKREQFFAENKSDAEIMFQQTTNPNLDYFVHSVRKLLD